MPRKLNCWEFHNCGREKGGLMVSILGECPVSISMKHDGQNEGVGGGRVCWMVAGSACSMKNNDSKNKCYECSFYRRVVFEQDKETVCKYKSIKL